MNRRDLLAASVAALTFASASRALAQPAARRRVVVIGAGILGASIAYHLAVSGAKVTVLEKARPAAGATENSFAWLNAAAKRPRAYHTLNLLGILGWHRLQAALGPKALPIQWGGCVEWFARADRADRARAEILRQQSWGYSTRLIGEAEVKRLLPGVTPGEITTASFNDVEGSANPTILNAALLKAARDLGVKIEYPVTVEDFDMASGRVRRVLTSNGAIDCDEVVLAAGLAIEALAAKLQAKVPLISSVGLLAHTTPQPRALNRLAFGPGATVKQQPDGAFVTGDSFGGTPAGAKADAETGRALIATAAKYVPAVRGAKLEWVSLGYRVLPKDGQPIVGPLGSAPNVYVAAMHSGLTQAPIIGQLAAAEILGAPQADLLEPFRPSRFV